MKQNFAVFLILFLNCLLLYPAQQMTEEEFNKILLRGSRKELQQLPPIKHYESESPINLIPVNATMNAQQNSENENSTPQPRPSPENNCWLLRLLAQDARNNNLDSQSVFNDSFARAPSTIARTPSTIVTFIGHDTSQVSSSSKFESNEK